MRVVCGKEVLLNFVFSYMPPKFLMFFQQNKTSPLFAKKREKLKNQSVGNYKGFIVFINNCLCWKKMLYS